MHLPAEFFVILGAMFYHTNPVRPGPFRARCIVDPRVSNAHTYSQCETDVA